MLSCVLKKGDATQARATLGILGAPRDTKLPNPINSIPNTVNLTAYGLSSAQPAIDSSTARQARRCFRPLCWPQVPPCPLTLDDTMKTYRIGQIVPSSNTTMETEIPAMLNARQHLLPEERFTFHAARMRMMHVTRDELTAMDQQSDRCARELSDARCDVLAYACLVAIMCQGPGYHRQSERRLARINGASPGSPATIRRPRRSSVPPARCATASRPWGSARWRS